MFLAVLTMASVTAGLGPAQAQVVGAPPSIAVTNTADPTTRNEPGGDFTFTVRVMNAGARAVTLTSLSDSVYGNLNGRGTCATAPSGSRPPTGPLLAANDGTYTCGFVGSFIAPGAASQSSVITAVAVDIDGQTATASDDATVSVVAVPPIIRVDVSVNPSSLPEPGGTFTYTVVVSNPSTVEAVVVTTLTDSIYGDLATRPGSTCGAVIRATLAPGASSMCTFPGSYFGAGGASLFNVTTVVAVDDDGQVATDNDDAIARITSVALPRRPVNDFDGNGTTDVAVFRPANGTWYLRTPTPSAVVWGQNGDIPVPGDYNGDAFTDLAVFRPANNAWYIRTPVPQFVAWGQAGDIPVPGDYDGNGTTDVAVFRPATGTWFLRTATPSAVVWGQAGDIPVPGDYDGNGTVDIAVFRPSNSAWYIRTPTAQFVLWGQAGDVPTPGDYDGNGTTDVAVFRPANGTWYLRTPSPTAIVWGQSGDVPQPGDYDGNGSTDLAVFRPATNTWFVRSASPFNVVWGQTGDKSLALPDAIRRFF